MKKSIIMALGLIMTWAGPGLAGQAQDPKDYQLETITVTAQKQKENPQKIPISMDALSDISVEDSMISNSIDLIQLSSNVHMMDSPYENVIIIRGMSSFVGSIYSPAAYYVNGVGYGMHTMHDNDLFDIERIEILKGPQGTLYGKNSESGVVNIITKQPDNTFQAKILGEMGNYNSFRTQARMSGPIVQDTLFFGGALQYRRSDGFFENLYNHNDESGSLDRISGRATLRWTPSDPWDISFIADAQEADDDMGVFRYARGPLTTDPHTTNHDETDQEYTERGNTQILNINYKSRAFEVASITGATFRTMTKFNDSDLWHNPKRRMTNRYNFEDRQYSQEIRISSKNPGHWRWLAGLFAAHEQTDLDHKNTLVSQNRLMSHHITNIETTGTAVFGQGTYTFFDKLHFTLGLRLDRQDLEGGYRNRATTDTAFQKDLDYTELLPKASIAYDLSPDAMIYTTLAKGFLAGGYNWCMNPTKNTFHFDPEYSMNYEAGIKTSWFNNKMTANFSLFYITIDDKQVSMVDPATRWNSIANAAEAYSWGFECQLRAKPAPGLELFADLGWNQAKFDSFSSTTWNAGYTDVITRDLSGKTLPYAPEYTFNAGVQYRSQWGLMARLDILGTGRFYGDPENQGCQSAYQLVNLKLGYEAEGWEAYVWSKNIFDKSYLTWLYSKGEHLFAMDGAPRTFGLTIAFRF